MAHSSKKQERPQRLWIILRRYLDEDGDPNFWVNADEPPYTSQREARSVIRQYHANPLIKRGEYRAFPYRAE